ncbi:LIM domain-containing protein isoform X2 [Anguilla rostrata]
MLSPVKKNTASKAKMADQTHQMEVAEGFNEIDAGRYQNLPSQNSHQQNCSLRSAESHVFLPICPPKETFSEFYQKRQKSELKRLYRHTHPELKALNNVIDKDLEEAPNSELEHTTTSNRYEGEVQSMRWMFENWTLDNSHHRDPHTTKEFLEENIASQEGDVKGTSSMFEHRKDTDQFKVTAGLSIKDCVREGIHKDTWMSEKHPIDALKSPGQDDAGMEAEQWNELIQSGDVFRAELCYVLHDSPGNMCKLKPTFNKELLSSNVKMQHWTPSADKSVIFQGNPLEEDQKDSIGRDRQGWMTEGQTLDDVCQVAKEDKYQETADTVKEVNVMAKTQLFETQPLAAFKEELSDSEHTESKEDIVGADVRSILWSFETKSVENHKDSNKLRGWEKVSVSGGERGLVMKTKHVHEPSTIDCVRQGNMEGESVQNACGTENNDVKYCKLHFETIPQRNLAHLENDNKALNSISCNIKYNKALFETTPVKDCSGIFHEVTTVGREKKTVNGNVPNYKWMFETRMQDQLKEGKINFEFNRGREIDCLNSASKEASHSRDSHSKRTCAFGLENKEMVGIHKTELDEMIVDEQSSDLQAAMRSLRQATDEARFIEHTVQERQRASAQKCLNQASQAVSLSTVDDAVQRSEQETDSDVVSGNVKAAINAQQGSTILQSVDDEEIVKGSFQAALRSLEKSNINISKGDFKAAMLYRNAGKSYSAQKKKQALQTVCKQANVESLPSSHTQLSHSVPLMTDKLAPMKKAVVEDHITDRTTNAKPPSSILSNQSQNPLPFNPRPVKQKPAIPPKPDHLKKIPGPVTRSLPVHTKRSEHLQQTQ